eukprot:COSAG01_NODE_542_length_15693_cov_13.246253_10_plen_182_part_00
MTATVTAAPPWGSRSDGQTGFLPRGSPQPSPQSYERPLGEVLSSTDNSWGISPRIGVIADDDRCAHWPPPVGSWDAHVYFDEGTVEEALSLRHLVCDAFPHLTVNRPYRSPIGPHPTSMWSAELHTPDQLAAFLPWLCTRNGALSVLVHPNTGNALDDHTLHCYWLGDKLSLRLDVFRSRL